MMVRNTVAGWCTVDLVSNKCTVIPSFNSSYSNKTYTVIYQCDHELFYGQLVLFTIHL